MLSVEFLQRRFSETGEGLPETTGHKRKTVDLTVITEMALFTLCKKSSLAHGAFFII